MNVSRIAVLDSSVVVTGIGWRDGDGRQVLCQLALRQFRSVVSPQLAGEWHQSVARVAQTVRQWSNPNWSGWLDWIRRASRIVDAVPLKPTVKRDPADDPVLAAALAGNARWIVSYVKTCWPWASRGAS